MSETKMPPMPLYGYAAENPKEIVYSPDNFEVQFFTTGTYFLLRSWAVDRVRELEAENAALKAQVETAKQESPMKAISLVHAEGQRYGMDISPATGKIAYVKHRCLLDIEGQLRALLAQPTPKESE